MTRRRRHAGSPCRAGQVSEPERIARTVEHLSARRERRVDVDEPTGILTHHLDLGTDAWDFLHELCARTRVHKAARWLDVRRAFGDGSVRMGYAG